MSWHLAQINVGRLLAPVDSPKVADFVDNLARINALADAAPGFVWRLQSDSGDALDFRPGDDDNDEQSLINISVWEDIESLHKYVYRSAHVEFMQRRKEWFEPPRQAHIALWWIPNGHIPDINEAMAKLNTLRQHGPSREAFTFAHPFPEPDSNTRNQHQTPTPDPTGRLEHQDPTPDSNTGFNHQTPTQKSRLTMSPTQLLKQSFRTTNRSLRYLGILVGVLAIVIGTLLFTGSLNLDVELDGIGPLNPWLAAGIFLTALFTALYIIIFNMIMLYLTIQCLYRFLRQRINQTR